MALLNISQKENIPAVTYSLINSLFHCKTQRKPLVKYIPIPPRLPSMVENTEIIQTSNTFNYKFPSNRVKLVQNAFIPQLFIMHHILKTILSPLSIPFY